MRGTLLLLIEVHRAFHLDHGTEIGDLNNLERLGLMVVILRYFAEFGSFGDNCVTVVGVRPILLRQKCSARNLLFGNVNYYEI